MPKFLVQGAYTREAWAALVKNPQDRSEAVRSVAESLGGRLESIYMAFGEYDVVGVVEMPANVEAAAFSIAILAGGAVKAAKTTPLLDLDEGVEAMRRAGGVAYRPPG